MVNFFRKIRLKLWRENKFSRYLVYAIGEIVLVVLGILIALSVNNGNDHNKAVSQSKIHLNNMLQDLATDTLYLGKLLKKTSDQLELEDWIMNKDSFTVNDIDSIKLYASDINWIFHLNDRAFQNIQNGDGSKLTGYSQLYSVISNYYQVTKNRIQQNNSIELNASQRKDKFEEVLNNNLILENRKYGDYSGYQVSLQAPKYDHNNGNFNTILNSLKLFSTQNSIREKYSRHSFNHLTILMCYLESKKLIKIIRKILNES